jgi:hypothetical protein
MESKSTMEQGESSEGRAAYGAAQVELALMGTIKELLREHREMIARLMQQNGNGSAALVPSVDGGPSADLIAKYREIRRALALPDDGPVLDGSTRTSSIPVA